jgi:hypothetical protein
MHTTASYKWPKLHIYIIRTFPIVDFDLDISRSALMFAGASLAAELLLPMENYIGDIPNNLTSHINSRGPWL